MFRLTSLLFLLVCIGISQTFLAKVKATEVNSVPAGQPDGCTYYISPTGSDTNSGTIQAPWQHLQKAFETLTAREVACLRGGTYEPPVPITPRVTGTRFRGRANRATLSSSEIIQEKLPSYVDW